MKITQDEVVDRQTVLHIELEEDDLDTYLDQGYRRVVQRMAVPGFRKGKAPRLIVERFVGRESLLNEVLDSMLPEVTTQAITEKELDAAAMPSIELLDLDPPTLKATVPLTPHVELGAYRDVRIAKDPVKVKDEDVEERLEQLRREVAPWESAERSVAAGDTVTINAAGRVEGRTVLEQEGAVFRVEEGGTDPLPGFHEQLIGLSVDETKEFTLDVPEKHPDNSVAGREARFSVTVSEVKEQVLPELDDEFAKSVGDGHEDLDALRQDLEKKIRDEAEEESNRRYRESVVDAVVESSTVDLPPLMVDHRVEHMEENRANTLERLNIRADDYYRSMGTTQEEARNSMREEVAERLKRTFALSTVAKLEGIEVSDEEVTERVESVAKESSPGADTPPDPGELEDSVRQVLLVEKTLDRLVAVAEGVAEEPQEPEKKTETEKQESGSEGGGSAEEGETDDKQA